MLAREINELKKALALSRMETEEANRSVRILTEARTALRAELSVKDDSLKILRAAFEAQKNETVKAGDLLVKLEEERNYFEGKLEERSDELFELREKFEELEDAHELTMKSEASRRGKVSDVNRRARELRLLHPELTWNQALKKTKESR